MNVVFSSNLILAKVLVSYKNLYKVRRPLVVIFKRLFKKVECLGLFTGAE